MRATWFATSSPITAATTYTLKCLDLQNQTVTKTEPRVPRWGHRPNPPQLPRALSTKNRVHVAAFIKDAHDLDRSFCYAIENDVA
jgi:hypothetical protein